MLVEDDDLEPLEIEVPKGTPIEEGPEGRRKPIPFGDIRRGWVLDAHFTGLMLTSYPGQMWARHLLVVERAAERPSACAVLDVKAATEEERKRGVAGWLVVRGRKTFQLEVRRNCLIEQRPGGILHTFDDIKRGGLIAVLPGEYYCVSDTPEVAKHILLLDRPAREGGREPKPPKSSKPAARWQVWEASPLPEGKEAQHLRLVYLRPPDAHGVVAADVRAGTPILEGPEGKRRPVRLSDLKGGCLVEAALDDADVATRPPLMVARSILLVERPKKER
jgi:hypothetical protein